jgi:hypothetical protein
MFSGYNLFCLQYSLVRSENMPVVTKLYHWHSESSFFKFHTLIVFTAVFTVAIDKRSTQQCAPESALKLLVHNGDTYEGILKIRVNINT